MCFIQNRIKTKGVSILLTAALTTTGLFSCQNTAYADTVALSEETYYHLDMGVQVAYNPRCSWGSERIYGDEKPIAISTTITLNDDVEVVDVYPLNSVKGASFDFSGGTSSHNIPHELGDGTSAYNWFYNDHTSTSMTEGGCSSSGKDISFNYTAKLNTEEPLEVVSYGEDGRDGEVYRLFGGKTALEEDQPEIAAAIATALDAGLRGTAGNNKLYLVFCPNVVAYKKYITVGELEAKLSLPSSAKQDEEYTVADASVVDSSLTIEDAILEKQYGSGNWEEVATWNGPGTPGKNTGGSAVESCDEITEITYRLTVTATNGQKDTDIKTIRITDGREVDGQAILELPAFTYEGHPAPARDVSVFTVDGVDYSARRAYEEGAAENEFLPLPSSAGSAVRKSLTTADVVFPKKGSYQVRLNVNTVSGGTLTDTKPITVRKTPYIIDDLGGFQKQNRKQVLSISVATYPGKPITDYSIELKDLKTGQIVTLDPSQPQQNNVTIKTRAVTTNGDAYWAYFQLPFLTKNTAAQEFRYTIYVKDSKGGTDTVERTFTVAPDLPPDARISIPESFIRNKGTNIAEIRAEDSSTTDGDQLQRTWTVHGADIRSLPGFRDNSFGSGQKVQYNKTGVGKETIELFAKDVWTEPTLEEYITPEDYKFSSATAVADVINIAPTVRLEPKPTMEADVAVLVSKASQSAVEAGINNMKAALIEAGVDANLQLIPTAIPNQDGYRRTAYIEWPVSINCSTCQTTGLVFDSEYAYRAVSAARTVSGYQEVCTNPHTIYAMDADGNTAWSYTVNEFGSFRIALDQQEKYSYIISYTDNKTVLLNRENGAYLTTLDLALPSGTYILQGGLIYILTGSNIQRYDPETGSLKIAAAVGGSLGRLQNGKIVFVQQENAYKFNIASFDPVNETISYQSIPELEEYSGTSGVFPVPADMDTTGKVAFTQTFRDEYNDVVGACLWLADAENSRVYNLGRVASLYDCRANSVGFVKDETGRAMFMYHGMGDDDSTSKTTRHYYYLNIYTLGDGDNPPVCHRIYSGKNNSINYLGAVSYAQYHSDENAICIMMGAAWQGYDWGGNRSGLMYKIYIPGWSVDSNQYNWGWDVADESGAWNDSLAATYYSYDSWTGMENRVKLYKHSMTADQAIEYALDKFANFRSGVANIIETSFTSTQSLVDKVLQSIKERFSLRFSISDGGEASLSRSYKLKPGQTYYYEYEVKEPTADGKEDDAKVNVSAPQITFNTQDVYEGAGNLESYYVSDIIEEDFNGALNPFFTLDFGGISDGLQTPGTAHYRSNRDLSASSQISFTIPAGKTAVAMMDVTGRNDEITSRGWRSGVYINGQRYDRQPMSDLNVPGYVHPYLLREGVNTITVYTCEYSNQIDHNYMKIDNLKIIFLDKNPEASGHRFSSVKTDDGWTRVTGTFKAPEKVSEFRSQSMTHYSDWPPGLTTSVNGNYTYYNFVIPAGKTGRVFATFYGYTSRSNTTAGTFTFPGWSITHRGTRSYSNGTLQYVETGETYFSADVQGTAQFTCTAGYQRSLGFTKLETYVYPDNLAGKSSFFFSGDKVYSLSDAFKGDATIKINLNTDGTNAELLMRKLNIYYLDKGHKVYLYNKQLQSQSDLSGWTIANASADMYTETAPVKEEDAPMVYKKGQLVSYRIFYDDYEKDPSKKQYWRYTHTPMNDGPNPQAAFILDEEGNVVSSSGAVLAQSIPRLYIDGKYTVEHWQEDNTNRTGDLSGKVDYAQYDKLSNIESLTFYIEGGGAAPWITSIRTDPAEVKEGDIWRLKIGVDDAEKDALRLTTEVYKDKKLVYTHRQTNITADTSGTYPPVITGNPPAAEPGKYEVICTVRDWSGAGIGSYQFIVASEGKVTGFVNHTDQWDKNRKKYNLKRFSDEVNRPMQLGDYIAMATPRMRGTNVFWSGEKFVLQAETEGKPARVDIRIQTFSEEGILSNTGYSSELTKTGRKTASGAEIWEGILWDSGMINKWGRKRPEQLVFVFTASYPGGTVKTSEATVIMDSDRDYWQLHRLW